MEDKNLNKLPGIREIISDWAIWGFSGLAFAYWVLGWDKTKTDIIAAFGPKVYAIITAVVLLAAIGFSTLGGPRLVKMFIEFRKSGSVPDDTPK